MGLIRQRKEYDPYLTMGSDKVITNQYLQSYNHGLAHSRVSTSSAANMHFLMHLFGVIGRCQVIHREKRQQGIALSRKMAAH
jgi:hypothetical protein